MNNAATARLARGAACAVLLGAVLGGPVASASASDASIKSVIKSYDSKILVAEGHVVTAIGEYKKSGDPTGVKAAITTSISVLSSLKSAISAQSASSAKIKEGKIKFVKGLQSVIVVYRHLKTAYGEKKADPQAAKEEAKKALLALQRARKDLREGATLLR